ncbi:MAG: CatB-related O-acetyltransferase [Opitutales bacterium]|nr:CatB-related O-acetyltransferase [Opitutales bacterium]
MRRYFLGFLKNLFRRSTSILAAVDCFSKVSDKAKVYRQTKLVESSVGDYSYISPGSELIKANVGKFCSIGKHCKLGLTNHPMRHISTSPIFTKPDNAVGIVWTTENFSDFEKETPYLDIGNDVWIGSDAIVMSGLKIGSGAIIGAGAVVTKDVPPYAVAVGVPAKIIKYRFDEKTVGRLLEFRWWDLPEETLKKHIGAFQHDSSESQILELINTLESPK